MRYQFNIAFKAVLLLGLLASTATPAPLRSRDLAIGNIKSDTHRRGVDPIEPPVTVPKGPGVAPPRPGGGEPSTGTPPPRFGTDPAPPAPGGAPPPRIGSDPAAPEDPSVQDPDEGAGTSVQDPVVKGESNLNVLKDAITKNSASVDHDYLAKFQKDYVADFTPAGKPGTMDRIFTPETQTWLQSKGVQIGNQESDSGWAKVEVWADQSKTKGSVFQAYMKPSDGTMYITRAYRSVDEFYPTVPNAADRIPISEHMNQAWRAAAGDTPIQKVVTANIVNIQTEEFLEGLSEAFGAEEFDMTVSEGDNWSEMMSGVAGAPVVRWLADHHSEPHIGNRQPQSLDWRYGDNGLMYTDVNGVQVTDIFVIVHIG